MKRCPFCAEEIQDAAIKCRYCGERLAESVPPPPPPVSPSTFAAEQQPVAVAAQPTRRANLVFVSVAWLGYVLSWVVSNVLGLLMIRGFASNSARAKFGRCTEDSDCLAGLLGLIPSMPFSTVTFFILMGLTAYLGYRVRRAVLKGTALQGGSGGYGLVALSVATLILILVVRVGLR